MHVTDDGNLYLMPIDLDPSESRKLGYKECEDHGTKVFRTTPEWEIEKPNYKHFTREANIAAWFALQIGAKVRYFAPLTEPREVEGWPFVGLHSGARNA